MTNNPLDQRSRNLFILYLAAEAFIGIASVLMDGFTLEALHTTTRWSGRLSLLFFSFMLILRNQPEISWRFVSASPYHLFALIHGIHLVELVCYVQLSENKLIPIRLLGGFMAYVFIFAFPYLMYLYERGKFSAKALHIVRIIYFPYLWFIFFDVVSATGYEDFAKCWRSILGARDVVHLGDHAWHHRSVI